MSEIEIGEYIRTTDGEIEKVVLIYDNRYMNEDGNMTHFDEIKAHSKNILDIVEVGDYINGDIVNQITKNYISVGYITIGKRNIKNIRTILTHEQYKQNCYKVGDIE